jgi:hypothetical protein
MRLKQLFVFWLTFILLLLLSGCTSVAAWERGYLAKPQMALEPNPLQHHIHLHNYFSREAAASTHSGDGGGGCGCY